MVLSGQALHYKTSISLLLKTIQTANLPFVDAERMQRKIMKKQLISMILATSMSIVLMTGCGGSTGPSATNADGAEQTAKSENTEAVEGEVATEDQSTFAEESRYLVKTEKKYSVSEDGEKQLFQETTYDYDENGNVVHVHQNIYGQYDQESGTFYKNELDEKGRVIKSYVSSEGEENGDIFKIEEYSYSDGQYTKDTFSPETGEITASAIGFVHNGVCYMTEVKHYDIDHPKTEDSESYFYKITMEYEGLLPVERTVHFSGEQRKSVHIYEHEQVENNLPVVTKETIKDVTGEESTSYYEYTYIEFK